VWRVARACGGRLGRWAWDDQYRRGRWARIAHDRDPLTVSLVEKYANGGSIVELGCGAGTLAVVVSPAVYTSYLGIDLSEVAVERARGRAAELMRGKCSFMVGDMSTWPGAHGVSLIVVEEALMYLNSQQQDLLLRTCIKSLTPGGHLLVTAHSSDKHHDTLDRCRAKCNVVEEFQQCRAHLVLAPRCVNGRHLEINRDV
jgi:SAM-dependent methyltransferase